MANIIAVANEKGGVGKTTTTHTLGNAFVSMGYNVLLIDADAQGNLSIACGYDGDELAKQNKTLAHVLAGNTDTADAIIKGTPALIGSNRLLQELNEVLTRQDDPPTRLRAYLSPVTSSFDYILIDCGPGITPATRNALGAADQILIPTGLDQYSLRGIESIFATIGRITEEHNPRLRVLGILPTKYAKHQQSERQYLAELNERFGPHTTIFEPIPHTGWVNNQVSKIKSIVVSRPGSIGAKNYMALARYIDSLKTSAPADIDVGEPVEEAEIA